MLKHKGNSFIALLLCFTLLGSSRAGPLADFEAAVDKPVPPSAYTEEERHYSADRDAGSSDSDGTFLVQLVVGLGYGAYRGVRWLVYDWWADPDDDHLVADSSGDAAYTKDAFADEEPDALTHQIGTPGAPYVRFDYRWQYLDSDVDAHDFLLEAGYKYAALYGRRTTYEDRADSESLDIEQYYGMLRYGGSDPFFFPGSFQVGAGAGWYSIEGSQTQEGPALTVPLMLYPGEWFGFEFRPVWAWLNQKTVSDYDISMAVGHRFTHFRLGYRWLWVQHEGHWLDGPYAGVSVSF